MNSDAAVTLDSNTFQVGAVEVVEGWRGGCGRQEILSMDAHVLLSVCVCGLYTYKGPDRMDTLNRTLV